MVEAIVGLLLSGIHCVDLYELKLFAIDGYYRWGLTNASLNVHLAS